MGANASGRSNFVHIFQFLRDLTRYNLGDAISIQGGAEYDEADKDVSHVTVSESQVYPSRVVRFILFTYL